MMFLPLQALFGEEAALRSPAPDVNDIVTCFHIHHFRFFAAAQTVSLDGFASLCSTVGERGIPTRTSEVTTIKTVKNIQNAKSLPHGDPPKVCMASEQPSRIAEAKDVKFGI